LLIILREKDALAPNPYNSNKGLTNRSLENKKPPLSDKDEEKRDDITVKDRDISGLENVGDKQIFD